MKTLTNLTWLLLLTLLLCSSCKDEQRVLNSIDGKWQVVSVTHLKPSAETLPATGFFSFEKCDQGGGSNDCPGEYVFDDKPSLGYRFSVLEKGKLINFASFTQQAFEQTDRLFVLQGPFKVIRQTGTHLELEGTMTIGDKAAGPVLAEIRLVLER